MRQKESKPRVRDAAQALVTLQWLCSKMERCENDARRSLYRWQVPREDWDGVISKLIDDKFIDHQRYAAAFTREKVSTSNWGVTKIINALRTKGIDKEIIDEAIAEWVRPDEMTEKLELFITRRLEKEASKAKNPYDLRARVFRAAASRGYDFDHINTLLSRHLSVDEF